TTARYQLGCWRTHAKLVPVRLGSVPARETVRRRSQRADKYLKNRIICVESTPIANCPPGRPGAGHATIGASIGPALDRYWQARWERLPPAAAGGTLRVDVERIDRLACRNEQAVAFDPAEADVGGAFGQRDAADWLAVGREYRDAVEFS